MTAACLFRELLVEKYAEHKLDPNSGVEELRR